MPVDYFQKLREDIRYEDGMNACLSCGICTSVCPSAEFSEYDPRKLMLMVQANDPSQMESLLESDYIWYCGQCMSCKTRCPRDNTPGMVVQALRRVSQETGLFANSQRGRQQIRIKRTVGENLLKHGFCVHPRMVAPDEHPEQGPVWQWVYEHLEDVFEQMSSKIYKEGPGAARKIDDESIQELNKIFEITGSKRLFDLIEYYVPEE